MSPRDESRIVLLLASVQFVNILDFMIVMPLGPDFAGELGIPNSQLNLVVGAYMGAACLAGLAGAFVLDRFDRRKALTVALAGLAIGTAGGALAQGLGSLVLARVIAGAFGGPATALALAILADVVPPERRGRALGSVMIAFSISSVLGVPAGLELSHRGTWHTPFIATGLLALIAAGAAWQVLPPLRKHLERPPEPALEGFRHLLSRPLTQLSYVMSGVQFIATFVLVPSIAAFVQFNLHYPRAQLGLLYGAGGLVSLATLRPIGKLVDRFGSFAIGTAGVLAAASMTWIGFVRADPRLPVMALFMLFMLSNGLRNVSVSTLTTKVPRADERARFMSLQSVVQHGSSFVGTLIAAQILGETPAGALTHIDVVAWVSIGLMALLPPMLWVVESRVRAPAPAATPAAAE